MTEAAFVVCHAGESTVSQALLFAQRYADFDAGRRAESLALTLEELAARRA